MSIRKAFIESCCGNMTIEAAAEIWGRGKGEVKGENQKRKKCICKIAKKRAPHIEKAFEEKEKERF